MLYPTHCVINTTAVVTTLSGLSLSEKLSPTKLITMGSICPLFHLITKLFASVFFTCLMSFFKCLQLHSIEVSWTSNSGLIINCIQFPGEDNRNGSLTVAFLTVQLLV